MALPILPQPDPFSKINPRHRLADGLAALVYFGTPGHPPIDCVSGRAGTLGGSAATPSQEVIGSAMTMPNKSSYYTWGNGGFTKHTGNITVATRLKTPSSSASGYGFCRLGGTGSDAYHCGFDNGTVKVVFVLTGVIAIGTNIPFTTNAFMDIILSYRKGVGLTYFAWNLLTGAFTSGVTLSASSPGAGNTQDSVPDYTATIGYDAPISCLYVAHRDWRYADALSFHNDAFGVLRWPRRIPRFAGPAAAAGYGRPIMRGGILCSPIIQYQEEAA